MHRILLALAALLTLAACGSAEPKWAPDKAVAEARYQAPGPKTITLFTVLSTRNGSGAHAGLMINGSQRVMFDPAGTWYHPSVPERNDVHFGMTPKMVDFYIDYHVKGFTGGCGNRDEPRHGVRGRPQSPMHKKYFLYIAWGSRL